MNRSVLERQMFKKGGAVFPDLSGDGKVTQKDVLMGRGVLPMQEGGMVPMDGMGIPAGLPAAAAQPSAAQGPDQIDPAMLEQMLQQAQTQFADLDQAGDYEEMMNAIRGDQMSVGERRQELAELVGPEDAQETPESVLTLLQPVMQLAAVEQGIGGLAEEAMGGGAVEGPMAEGIMSTVNMGGPAPAAPGPAMPMEGGAPVQGFRYGGAVQRFKEGGGVELGSFGRAQELFPAYQGMYQDLLGGTPAEDLADRKRLAQSQALFDIAQAGFAFAQPGSRRQSMASRLGEAVTETQLFPKIGARAAELQGFKEEQARQSRATDLAALQGALGQAQTEQKLLSDMQLAAFKAQKDNRVVRTVGDTLIDATDPTNPLILYQDPNSQREIRTVGGAVIDVTNPQDVSVLYQDPSADVRSVGDSLVNVTDPENPTVIYTKPLSELRTVKGNLVYVQQDADGNPVTKSLFEVPDESTYKTQIVVDTRTGQEQYVNANSPEGQAAIARASAQNAASGQTLFEVRDVPSLQQRSAKAFRLPEGQLVLSYDGGRTYTTQAGAPAQIPQGSIPLSDTIANDVRRTETINAAASDALAQMDSSMLTGLRGGTPSDPKFLSEQDRNSVALAIDAPRAALEGTGPYSNFAAAADATLGSLVPGLSDIWTDTQENRQFLKGLRVLGRSALVVNPRFPVAEMENVAELFPDEKTVFTNPESELIKLKNLRDLALRQKRFNLEQLVTESDSSVQSQIRANNFEIDRLLGLLGPLAPRDDSDRVNRLRGTFTRQSQQGR
jgi:hypothetical protein